MKVGRKCYADDKWCLFLGLFRTLSELRGLRKVGQKSNYEYWIFKEVKRSSRALFYVIFHNISGWTMENHRHRMCQSGCVFRIGPGTFCMHHGDITMGSRAWDPDDLIINSLSTHVTIQPIFVIVLLWIVQFISYNIWKQWIVGFIFEINVNPTFVIIRHCSLS